jgi:hypothetical protein
MSFNDSDKEYNTFLTDHKRGLLPDSRLGPVHQKLIDEILDFAEKIKAKKKDLLEKSSV